MPVLAPGQDAAARATPLPPATGPAPVLDVVVPVHQEEAVLRASVEQLLAHLAGLPWSARVTVVDNASTDRTWEIASALAAELAGVRALRLERKGRGGALRAAWTASDAAVVAYTDVDLSTDLAALEPLVAAVVTGRCEVAVGTRLHPGARVRRSLLREALSRGYNALLRVALGVRFSDAQCGFKAVGAERARQVLPLVRDDGWFFDTELLVLAERSGWRVQEVPVTWREDADSRVRLLPTVVGDLRGVARLAVGLRTRRTALPPAGPLAPAPAGPRR